MDKYKEFLVPSPYKRAAKSFAFGISCVLISISCYNSQSLFLKLLSMVIILGCPIFIFIGLLNLSYHKEYTKILKIAAENDLNPTFGYGKVGYLLVDPHKRMLICNGNLFQFDEIKTIEYKEKDATRLRNLPSSVNKLRIIGRDGRIVEMVCRTEDDATSILVRLSEATGMEYC